MMDFKEHIDQGRDEQDDDPGSVDEFGDEDDDDDAAVTRAPKPLMTERGASFVPGIVSSRRPWPIGQW